MRSLLLVILAFSAAVALAWSLAVLEGRAETRDP
jgi:hypothetical protein